MPSNSWFFDILQLFEVSMWPLLLFIALATIQMTLIDMASVLLLSVSAFGISPVVSAPVI